MKKIITSALLVLSILTNVQGQIIFEAVNNDHILSLIRLSNSGSKYLSVTNTSDAIPDTIMLYNLDHTPFKTILIPSFSAPNGYDVKYITDALFDTDSSDIDYLLTVHSTSAPGIDGKIKIFEESGNQLLNLDSSGLGYSGGGLFNGEDLVPIFETDSGAKLITFKSQFLGAGGSSYHIYSLPGHLPCSLCGSHTDSPVAIHEQNAAGEDFLLSNPYPNPSNSTIKIEYHLPKDAKTGSITFYDTYGNFIKRYNVDRHAEQLILNVKDFAAGNYLYQLVTDTGKSIGKKMLVVK